MLRANKHLEFIHLDPQNKALSIRTPQGSHEPLHMLDILMSIKIGQRFSIILTWTVPDRQREVTVKAHFWQDGSVERDHYCITLVLRELLQASNVPLSGSIIPDISSPYPDEKKG